MSKLNTDRSIRMLMDLMQQPGNDVCADCKSPSPRWASYNLGIFLCVHCASIHRKMGTHISKVKSLNMDQWTKDQIDSIRTTGNLTSNAIYNPSEVEPPVNLHDSERDSELEKYIRNKYQFRKFMNMRKDGREWESTSGSRSSARDSGRIEEGRQRARELLTTTPARTSSAAQVDQPRKASPALTTKSPAPPTVSPAPPTPSPSLPSTQVPQQPPLQMLAPSPQPPMQAFSTSPQPPLQILSPSGFSPIPQTVGILPTQTGLLPMATGAYQPAMFTGMSGAPLVTSPALPNSNPVWQDMAAIQTGPALPTLGPSLNPGLAYGATAFPSTLPIANTMTGWSNPAPLTVTPMMGGAVSAPTGSPYPAMSAPYLQSPSINPTQPQYVQPQPMYAAQQPQLQLQQPLYVQNGVIMQQAPLMQPPPIQNTNPVLWNQGGVYGAGVQGQWQG